jgi:hypothetical protein
MTINISAPVRTSFGLYPSIRCTNVGPPRGPSPRESPQALQSATCKALMNWWISGFLLEIIKNKNAAALGCLQLLYIYTYNYKLYV